MRRAAYAAALAGLLILGLLVGFASSGGAEAASAGRFSYTGTVTRVVDGDTLDVTVSTGKRERVRVIGIDTPERGACFFNQASRRTSSLALGKRVVLVGDPTQDTRDRYGRLLAYVDIGGSQDLGVRLVREGYAAVYVFRRPFARLASYQSAAASAKTAKAGLYTACAVLTPRPAPTPTPTPTPALPSAPVPTQPPATTTPATTTAAPPAPAPPPPTTTQAPAPTTTQAPAASGGCHPNYSNCLPIVSDLNCPDVRAMGKAPVQVIGADPYRLDADNDGLGCE